MRTQWPRLSVTLTGPVSPDRCRSCGIEGEEGLGYNPVSLTRWQECSSYDTPEDIIVVLCKTCSDRIIEPHPRLYKPLPVNAPLPGCMAICVDCRHRSGLKCKHPDLTANGGTGLAMIVSKPQVIFLDGTNKQGKRVGWQHLTYANPPRDCKGHEPRVDFDNRYTEAHS